jgi:hypothetical protein
MIPAQQLRQLRDVLADLLQANDVCLCHLDHLGGLGQGLPLSHTAPTGIVGHDPHDGLFAGLFVFCAHGRDKKGHRDK